MAHTHSPAILALMAHGVRLRDIGDRIGRSPATVSRQLSGENPPHPDLIDAVRLVAGSDAADAIARLIATNRSDG